MYITEKIFDSLTYEELYLTLKLVLNEDIFLEEVEEDPRLDDFFYLLDVYDLVFVSSDDRILLTQKGEKIFQYLFQIVEIDKLSHKINKP